jgi:hypothetical protein
MSRTQTDPGPSPRLAHLDRLKILLTAGVIVAHAAMSYGAAGTWIYEEDSLSSAGGLLLSVLVGAGVMFVLGLFFLVAGMLTSGPLHRRGPREFLVSRLWRLGVPVAVYALVLWPLLGWWVDTVEGEAPPLWEAYGNAFSASRWQELGTGPTWFLAILLVVTVGWCLWRWWVPAGPSRLSPGATAAVAGAGVAVGTFVVRLGFPIDSAQFLDLHVWIWPQSVGLFVLGAVGAEEGWIWSVPRPVLRGCRVAVLGAVVLLAVLVVTSDGPDAFMGGWYREAAGWAVCEGAVSVGVSLLLLDWSRRHVVSYGARERAVAGAAYGAFLAQGPVLVAGALLLEGLDLTGDLKFVLLAAIGVLGSFAVGLAAVQAVRQVSAYRHRQAAPRST